MNKTNINTCREYILERLSQISSDHSYPSEEKALALLLIMTTEVLKNE
jgi:hypothetical protein